MKEKFVLTEYEIPVPAAVPALRLALVSDLHEQDPQPVLALLRRAQPDVICVAGDTFERHDYGKEPCRSHGTSRAMRVAHRVSALLSVLLHSRERGKPGNGYRFLEQAARLAPVFLSLGNHEWYLSGRDRSVLRRAGVRLLDNADCIWNGVRLGGLSTAADTAWLETYRQKSGFRILLCHHPEYVDCYDLWDFDLILSGHVHGGQWRIGDRGLLAPDQGLLPRYCHGIYGGKLAVSAGCANTTLFPRFGNPCEVVLLHLCPEKPCRRERPGD